MFGITQYLLALIDAVHRHPFALSDLSRKSGLSHATLDRIRHAPVTLGAGGFNPTFRTIRELEKFLGGATYLNIIGHGTHSGSDSENLKIRLGLATGLWANEEIRRAHDYLEFTRAEHGRLGLEVVDYNAIVELCPSCAVHMVTIEDSAAATRIDRWGNAGNYRGGRDFSGASFAEFADASFLSCIHEDNFYLENTDMPLLTILSRVGEWRETGERVDRRFLRYMAKINAPGEKTTFISIRRLKGPNASLEIIDSIIERYRLPQGIQPPSLSSG